MKRLIVVVMACTLALAACAPGASGGNNQATMQAYSQKVAALTVAAQPTLTLPPSQTPLPTSTNPSTATSTPKPKPSSTITATAGTTTATSTGSVVPATATVTSANASQTSAVTGSPTRTVTGTPPTATKTPTMTVTQDMVTRVYGTQPPYIQYGRVHLINLSNRDVYISFQCTTPEGYHTIEEYPVYGRVTVSIPVGRCDWVAWVGGKQFTGRIGLGRFEELTMTFKKSSVTIK
jgi:hypothetical protein